MSWTTVLQVRPSGERLAGFQAVCAVLSRGEGGRQERPFGGPFGTSLGSFWASFFWCFFEVAFWWPWPPFGLPKHLQNETQKGAKDTSYQKVKIELSLQPELDPEGCGGV